MVLEHTFPPDDVQTLRRKDYVQMSICALENTISKESDPHLLKKYDGTLEVLKEYQ